MKLSNEKKSFIFLLIIIVIISAISLFLYFSLRQDPVSETLKNEPVIKVLLVADDGNKNVLFTDVFIYYPETQKGAFVDILGNTAQIWDSIKRVDRIDSIYREKGINVYRNEVAGLIGKTIPFTLEISLDDLGKLTDLLGGLTVVIHSPVDYVTEAGEHLLLPSGLINLDGDKLKVYMTYKLPDETDADVDNRRQTVLLALFSAFADNQEYIFNKKNFNYYSSRFRYNMESSSFYDLLYKISNVDSSALSVKTISGTTKDVDGEKLLFPFYNGQLIKDIVNQTITSLVNKDAVVQSRVYVLEIQNGTLERGLARNTSILMQSAGYEVLEATNADSSDYEHTVIINHIGQIGREVAQSLGDFIMCKNIQDEEIISDDTDMVNIAKADFTIILGRDFDGRYVKGGYKPSKEEEKK